jgi:hypothetical protein
LQQAELWAKRVLAQPALTAQVRIQNMYVTAFGRPPTPGELAEAVAFVEDGLRSAHVDDVAVWADLAHVLFNLKEFIFVD